MAHVSRTPYLATLAASLLGLVGCPSSPAGEEVAPNPSEASSVEEPHADHGSTSTHVVESAGLVGPGEANAAERIEVSIQTPPAPTLLFLAGMKGYTEPCGCTLDLVLGGIDRVTGFVLDARALAPASLVLDGGGLLFETIEVDEQNLVQDRRKAELLLDAHQQMGTTATTPGPSDFAGGIDYYLSQLAAREITVLSANLRQTSDGSALGPAWTLAEVGDEKVGIIGVADPALFEDVNGIEANPAFEAVQSALQELEAQGPSATLLLFQGNMSAARETFASIEGLDFILVAHEPRDTDEIESIGSAQTIEAYDQGRNVGRLTLVAGAEAEAGSGWSNARLGSNEDRERLERMIERGERQLEGLAGQEGAFVNTLRARVEGQRAELAALSAAELEFPAERRSFLYEPIPMEPGYRTESSVSDAMISLNAELQEINRASATPPPPAPEGTPHYVGAQVCQVCHSDAYEFWTTTQHYHAWETLEARDKTFDLDCIGCHVTGYQEPGGSSLGFTDRLEDVQCEQCHGPGSMHAQNPTLRNVPNGVHTAVPESTCIECHNEEHSTTFDYATYLPRVLGPGHGHPVTR